MWNPDTIPAFIIVPHQSASIAPPVRQPWPHTRSNSSFSHSSKTFGRLLHACFRCIFNFALPTNIIFPYLRANGLTANANYSLAKCKPFPFPAIQCLRRAVAIQNSRSSAGMVIEPDGPGLITYPIRPVLRLDLWRLFIKDFPARLSHTGIYRYAPTLIPCAKVPQLPRESDD